ncbi:MAG: RNA polymerase sporulation sigma factor SigK, partial [Oscillospiraceae bacterium]|nr:RNA polymerase sporulation sigma factor SigK [Oscillospiraceae bacterium]
MLSAFLVLINSVLWMLRLGSAGSFPRPLKAAEEQEYLQRWIDSSDIEARNKLIEHNLRLVAHIMKKYYTQNADQDDLISIGTIGLIKGVSTYRPDKGVRLATYASRCIENEILMFFRSSRKSAGDVSLSDTIETDGDGNSLSLMDILCTEDDMLDAISAKESYTQLRSCVETALTPREAEIITLRYGLSGKPPQPQREVAKLFGISRSYVSRIEKRALEKLKA